MAISSQRCQKERLYNQIIFSKNHSCVEDEFKDGEGVGQGMGLSARRPAVSWGRRDGTRTKEEVERRKWV